MRLYRLFLFSILFCLIFTSAVFGQKKSLLGFSAEQSIKQYKLESKFDSFLNADNLRTWMKRLSARPQHIGSPYRKENAEFILSLFKSWGFDARIETFEIYFPTPKVRILELMEPIFFKANLTTPPVEGDPVTKMQDEIIPSYNAYSIDGDVTAELVYVNRGMPDDYKELERRGISVNGKIVIVRYGGCFRGIKPKVAAEHGAIGCIIYSDPLDSGYSQGDVYPQGPFRTKFGVERGSVLDISVAPGDPLTPGIGATKDAKRLDIKDAKTITKIPTLPISYGNALPLLEALTGPVVPANWRGGLPVTYHFGPGPGKVHLKVEFDWKFVPAYDVIAFLKGQVLPDEWIIRGNHSDGWVAGASDPISGLVAMLEEARAVAKLTKTGWKPKRTMVYCAWDGEEPGLIGSTEWVEAHAGELKEKAAVYINTDSNGRGFLNAGGSPTLERFFNQIAQDVKDPETGVSVAERVFARKIARGSKEKSNSMKLSALGSGSDFTPFYQHLGIASLNMGFGGESRGGIGHSIYDTFEYYTKFVDSKFEYGVALAQTSGRAMLRLANAEILPVKLDLFVSRMKYNIDEIIRFADEIRQETEKQNQLIEKGIYKVASDPLSEIQLPQFEDLVPKFDFSPLQDVLLKMEGSLENYRKAKDAFSRSGKSLSKKQMKKLDQIYYKSERTLIRKEGLTGRPWYKHFIYAPGTYTGYGAKTLPGVREALEHRNWEEVKIQIPLVVVVLERYAQQIDKAATVFTK